MNANVMRNQGSSRFFALLFAACGLCFTTSLPASGNPTSKTGQENKTRPAEKNVAEKSAREPRTLFTAQEQQLIIYGLGNPIAQLLMMRELDRRWPLFPQQRFDLQQLSRHVTPKLADLRAKRARQERTLEEAIYGANFDAPHVEALAAESAATQEELVRLQGETEFRLLQILARGNPRRARTARAFVEFLIQPQPQRPLAQLMLARPNGGPMRFLSDFFGDDWDMAVPGFGNPASFLLVLNQLELTTEQKAEFKTLAQSIRTELQAEFNERNQASGNAAGLRETEETDPVESPATRRALIEQVIANNAARQARQVKRQTRIETRIRQILQPKQWDTYVTLLRGLAGAHMNWTLPNGGQKKLLRRPNASRPQPQVPDTF